MSHAILIGDCREQMRTLPEKSVHCVVTSPPYFGLRDYGVDGQIGLEPTPAEFVAAMVEVFAEVWRVLRDDGVCFVNLGDSYAGSWGAQSRGESNGEESSTLEGSSMLSARQIKAHPKGTHTGSLKNTPGLKAKDLIGIPWRVAIALQDKGWWLRQDIIWSKPNPNRESVRDRCTKSHEYIFVLTKSKRYFWDPVAIAVPAKTGSKGSKYNEGKTAVHQEGRASDKDREDGATSNRLSVWTISTQGYDGAHFAVFPERIPELCIRAATSEKGCCPGCGRPWQRLTKKVRKPTRSGVGSKVYVDPIGSPYEQHSGTIVGNRDPQRHVTETITTGWAPSCQCAAGEPVPCTVLDPFLGSGTTAQVATWLGRHGIGCELNETYAGLAEERIKTPPRFMTRKTTKGKKRRRSKSQGVLFKE